MKPEGTVLVVVGDEFGTVGHHRMDALKALLVAADMKVLSTPFEDASLFEPELPPLPKIDAREFAPFCPGPNRHTRRSVAKRSRSKRWRS